MSTVAYPWLDNTVPQQPSFREPGMPEAHFLRRTLSGNPENRGSTSPLALSSYGPYLCFIGYSSN